MNPKDTELISDDSVLRLTSGEIHVWLAFYDENTEEQLQLAYRELLSSAEREQEARFYFARDRHRYLITRALARTVLSRYVSTHPKEWIFSANAFGRPDIVNAEGRDACLSFNISHTDGLIVLAVAKDRALGVDVENVGARKALMEIAGRYFSASEVAQLRAAPLRQQQYCFFEYWTFKEAYIKARGMGLSLPLDKFSFHYPSDRTVEIEIDPQLVDDAGRWQFWQFQLAPAYLVAICAERGAQSSRVIVRQAVPMLCEREVAPEFLRVSA
jgi:4'-phosphopantetheinyl transferase